MYLGYAIEVLLAVVARLRLEHVPVEAEPNQVESQGLAGRNNHVRESSLQHRGEWLGPRYPHLGKVVA